ncbi:MAG: hypothetical protein ACOX50_04165 [Patescibacteria group bacterium]|jgi:hypothetical protein
MSKDQSKLITSKMPGETIQQYTAWQLYCLTGSFDRLLVTWQGLLQGYTKITPELDSLRNRLGRMVTRKTIALWSKKFSWVKRTELKNTEEVAQIRDEAMKFEKERKFKIIKAFRKALDIRLKKLDSGEEITVGELKQLWEMMRTEMGLVTDRSSVSVTGEQRLLTPEEEAEGKALDEFVKKFHKQKGKEENNGQ